MIKLSKPIIGSKEINAVNRTLRSGNIAQGPQVKAFEDQIASYCNISHAVAFNSGTAALHASLFALDLKEGDEVITTPFTFVATANAILMQGGKVVFADINEDDFNLDFESVRQKISNKTRVIIPVDLYGQIFDYQPIKKLAQAYKLSIVEDACQSIGAEQNKKKAGSFGNVGIFSLYATKNITCGEGGVLTTNNPIIAEKAKMFRHHGQSEKTHYEYFALGYNYRLTDIAASIAIEQLKKLEKFTKKRIEHADKLSKGLKGIKGLLTPITKKNNRHVFHQYTIRITSDFKTNRKALIDHLYRRGIESGVYYPKPLHLHPHFIKFGYRLGDFPIAEKIANQVLSLPVHPALSNQDVNYIIRVIQDYAS